MNNKFIAILILLSLLSQQAMAGAFSASMLGHMQSISSAPESSQMLDMTMGMHDYQTMLSDGDSAHNMDAMSHSSNSDCCDIGCHCNLACSSALMISFLSTFSSPVGSQVISQRSLEPLAQSIDTLFRPPIFA